MPAILLPRRHVSQPQSTAEIDWSNPLSRGLIFVNNAAIEPNNQFAGSSGFLYKSSPAGIGMSLDGKPGLKVRESRIVAGRPQSTIVSVFSTNGLTGHPNGQALYCERSEDVQILKLTMTTPTRVTFTARNAYGTLINTDTLAISEKVRPVHVAALSIRGPNERFVFYDGVTAFNTTGFDHTAYTTANDARIGNDLVDSITYFNGIIFATFLWDRGLSVDELNQLNVNPWQLFRAEPVRIFSLPTLTQRRPLFHEGGTIRQASDALLGTGRRPLVLMPDGEIREQKGAEGMPLVFEEGVLRGMDPTTETLMT